MGSNDSTGRAVIAEVQPGVPKVPAEVTVPVLAAT